MIRTFALVLAPVVVLGHAVAVAGPCTIHGDDVTIARVLVQPEHEEAFTVEVRHADVTATPTARGAQLEITGAVKFAGLAQQRLWYTATGDFTTGDGIVTLRRGAHVIGTGVDGDKLVGSAVMYASDVLEGEDKPADESVDSVRVACEKLSLDWFSDPVNASNDSDGTTWFARNGTPRFVLHAEPKASAKTVTYAYPSCEGKECLVVSRVTTKGAWTKVSAGNESVEIAGWVPTAQLRRAPDDVGFGHSYMCTGDHPGARETFGMGGPPPRTATLHRGAVISSRPKSGAWATVVKDLEVHVELKPGDTSAKVISLPGIGELEGHAYVSITSLTFR